jgi:hypothetical protein
MERVRSTINRQRLLLFFMVASSCLVTISSCRHPRQVNTSFYYWKTVYQHNKTEDACLRHFNVQKLYVRIMDVGTGEGSSAPIPVSPIVFKDKLSETLQIVPVVFIVNNILKTSSRTGLDSLAGNIIRFVGSKVKQSGKTAFHELQIDCDWTASSRENYFYLLNQIKLSTGMKQKILSATLRLHQLKNQAGSGVPPVDRVTLMCYNMGNLRKYGPQNSILELDELKRYLGDNINAYPMPVDVGLPLFSWAVAFRNKEYAGISKRIKIVDLNDKNRFIFIGNNIYKTAKDLPEFGLNKADEVRWEDVSVPVLQSTASYLSRFLKTGTLNVIYFHLDETVIKPYTYQDLEEVDHLLR